MDFSLSTDHEILRDSVRSFAEKEIKPMARKLDEKEEFSYETMQKMAELGLFGVFVSEKYGGQAMDYLSRQARQHNIRINMHLNPTYVASGTPLEKGCTLSSTRAVSKSNPTVAAI